MSNKKIFLFSAFCLIFSIVFSFSSIVISLKSLNQANYFYSAFYSAKEKEAENELTKEIQENYDLKVIAKGEKEEDVTEIAEEIDVINEYIEHPQKTSLGEFKLTAYCSCEKCCGKWASNRPIDENGNQIVYGASGAVLVAGDSVAVDPNVIPYGSTLEINGYEYKAHDCGGNIKGNRIDVYFDDHQKALEFGVQYKDVYLICGE